MPGKNLQQAAATLVQQVQARVQPLLADVTSLEVSTYSVDASQLESVAASEDVAALAQRHGYTRVTFQCDLNACTETGREEAVDAAARPMHNATVEAALKGRETLLAEGRQTLGKLRR
jgi:hypothetical protein